MKLLGMVKGIFDRLFIIVGAFLGSQIPEFVQQYIQRLSGHTEELSQLLSQLTKIAALSDKTLNEYVNKFLTSSDPDFAAQGMFMSGVISRWQNLHMSLLSLTDSPIWSRPYYLFKYLNYPIAESTFQSFKPGINLTLEGLCYAAFGMVIFYLVYQVLQKLIQVGYGLILKLFGIAKMHV